MDANYIGLFGVIILLILAMSSFHVGIAMGVVGVAGICILLGPVPASTLFTHMSFSTATVFDFAVIPLFTVMGIVLSHGGLVDDIYKLLDNVLVKVHGGIMIATMIAAGFFAACSGSSIAAAVTFSKISVPEMIKRKYSPWFATGGVAAVGTQSALIPPSAILIIYAIIAEQPVGKMLMAGLLPGILSNLLYCVAVVSVAKLLPGWAPPVDKNDHFSWVKTKRHIPWVWPIPVLMFLVLGAIYTGFATPSEAAAVGAFGAIVISFLLVFFKSRFTGEKISTYETIQRIKIGTAFTGACSSTAMIFFILIGAMFFGQFIMLSQLPNVFAEFIVNLEISKWLILIVIMLVWTVLGTFMSSIAVIVIIVPVILPVMIALEFDPLWFGVIVAKLTEMAMITPPVGMNLYAVKGAVGNTATFGEIVKGTLPFLAADVVTLAVLVAIPSISLLIPEAM